MLARTGKNQNVGKAVPYQIAGLHANTQAGEYTLSSEGRPVCPGKYLRGMQAAVEASLMRVEQSFDEQLDTRLHSATGARSKKNRLQAMSLPVMYWIHYPCYGDWSLQLK